MTARPLWSDRAWLGQPAPAFAAGVQSLLRASQGLATSGWEISVRLSPERVCLQRLLVGWETRGYRLRANVSWLPNGVSRPLCHQLGNPI